MPKTKIWTTPALVLATGHGGPNKKNNIFPKVNKKPKVRNFNQGLKRKADYKIAPTTNPKEAICFHFQEKGHGDITPLCH